MTGKRVWAIVLIVGGTVVGLAGTDLVLPAIPGLSDHLPGSLALAQMVLASFTAGVGLGLIVFGELGARISQYRLLLIALVLYAALSWLAAMATTMMELVVVRLFQGFAAAAPAVFAPGMIRAMFDSRGAMRAMGLVGSLESIVPAFAPILGAWLISRYDWQATFYVTAALSFVLFILWLFNRPPELKQTENSQRSYLYLLRSPIFMRYAMSQALTMGGLLAFVFGAPTVMIHSMDGTLSDFVVMQVLGISLFMISANTAHVLVDRIGREATIMFGSLLAVFGTSCILVYALLVEKGIPQVIWLLFALVNLGIGIRGPAGFYLAIVASKDNDARGTAIVLLAVFMFTAGTTALVAPFISYGLLPLAMAAMSLCLASVVVMRLLPRLPDGDLDLA